jgi:hypothetical protein
MNTLIVTITTTLVVTWAVAGDVSAYRILTRETESIPGKRLKSRTVVTENSHVRVVESSQFQVPGRTLLLRTLKVEPNSDTTVLEIDDPLAGSRNQFFFAKEELVFAQMDLDRNGSFEILVLFQSGQPQAAFRRGKDSPLVLLEGDDWLTVQSTCKLGSLPTEMQGNSRSDQDAPGGF